MSDRSFGGIYSGKRILVTGHTGFKGSWLAIWLDQMGAQVYGYALTAPSDPSNFALCRLHQRMESEIGDVENFKLLRQTIDSIKPELVFHLAAQPLVRRSYQAPRQTMNTNLMGTVNLLECVREQPSIRAVVVVTSDKCYENREWHYGYREADPLGGHDPYSASKGCQELITSAYYRSFFSEGAGGPRPRQVGIASARAGNVIGGGDWAEDRLLPDCVRALTWGNPVTLRHPQAIRPWQHVLEPLAGYLQLAAALLERPERYSGPWNFGPYADEIRTTREVAHAFLREWDRVTGARSKIIEREQSSELHEANLLQLSCDKALGQLSWRPVLSLDQAIQWTAGWYATWFNNREKDLYSLCAEQIERFGAMAASRSLCWAPASNPAPAPKPGTGAEATASKGDEG
jgi:CDP-glucose 4,6-dehydratase